MNKVWSWLIRSFLHKTQRSLDCLQIELQYMRISEANLGFDGDLPNKAMGWSFQNLEESNQEVKHLHLEEMTGRGCLGG